MRRPADINTPFAIDLEWWAHQQRNLNRFLADIVGDNPLEDADGEPLDYIDPDTAEVHQLEPLWVRVLDHHAHRPEYISGSTPLAAAVLRALIENLNRPMTAMDLHRRINRSSPETILRLMRTAESQYGIVPTTPQVAPRRARR
jgi:hypothetical protein